MLIIKKLQNNIIKITLEIPDDQIEEVLETPKKVVWKDGKVIFEDIKPKLPETWEEFCRNYEIQKGECFINPDSDIETVSSGIRVRYGDSNLLSNKQAAEQHLALMQLHQLRDCYRQGWLPKDSYEKQEPTYNIHISLGVLCIDYMYAYSSFLLFQTRELASKFLKNFRDLIIEAGDLI